MPSSRRALLSAGPLLLGLLALPPSLTAQETAPSPSPAAEAPVDRAALRAELEQVREELLDILDRASRQPALQDRWARLSDLLRTTMLELEPAVADDLARIQELDVQAETALRTRDATRFRALMAEAEEIEARLGRVQLQAMGTRTVAGANARYHLDLQDAMRDLEPRTRGLVRRMQTLESRLGVESVGVLRYLLP